MPITRPPHPASASQSSAQGPGNAEQPGHEAELLSNTRQLVFEGRRSGEGYFSADGTKMVFQSERQAGNPFYQIYPMDLGTGDTRRVSTGTGKTTCAWIHPSGERVLFSSTHEDPNAARKQREELDKRASGTSSRYSWSFDEHYEIYEADTRGEILRKLTDAPGYDAEGSWSLDGSRIVFASNRLAWASGRTPDSKAQIFIADWDDDAARHLLGLGTDERDLKLDRDWRPLAFSGSGDLNTGELVFAGYGIQAPAEGDFPAYDSYAGLDVSGKWVLVFRYLPEDLPPERRRHLHEYAELRFKSMTARDKGARGLLIVSGPSSQVEEQLVPLASEAGAGGGSLPVISVSDEIGAELISASGRDLGSLQKGLDGGEPGEGIPLPGVRPEGAIALDKETASDRNVLGRLNAGDSPGTSLVVLGAHVDHIGLGKGGPVEQGGMRAGDLIQAVAGRTIENIYDYTYALNALKVG